MGPPWPWFPVTHCQDSRAADADQDTEKRWAQLFDQLDLNKDGCIDSNELREWLAGRGLSRDSIERIMEAGDTNQDGILDFEEFMQYLHTNEKQLKSAFASVDKNEDGKVDASEIQHSLRSIGVNISLQDAAKILQRMDKDGNMTIDWNEWRDYFLFNPLSNLEDVAHYWKRSLMLDIGEQLTVPDEFSEEERKSGFVWRQLMAGAVAGCAARTVTAPIDRVKVFRQVYGSSGYQGGIWKTLQHMVKEGGLLALWRGNGVNVLKIAPETVIKFTAYDQIKKVMHCNSDQRNLRVHEKFVAGSLAGATAQTVIYPMEVLKTRLTLRKTGQISGLADCTKLILQREGIAAFYRGYLPNMLSIIPYAGIDLAVYETLKNFWLNRNKGLADPGVIVLVGSGASSSTCGLLASYPLVMVRTRMQAQVSVKGAPKPSMLTLIHSILSQEGVAGLYGGISSNLLKVIPAMSVSYVVYEYMKILLGMKPEGWTAGKEKA
ncbi:mitochondrial adenyl nucleotide antiporter SLC25A24-A-like [Brachionichthys hirsutus]|uniref:mitochondrial adenyl nucleotide antiporter SLC25A24-A-like n=1 Tax=Brachionichthys hirsutus TaxID=412623 RepID=UPI003604AB78